MMMPDQQDRQKEAGRVAHRISDMFRQEEHSYERTGAPVPPTGAGAGVYSGDRDRDGERQPEGGHQHCYRVVLPPGPVGVCFETVFHPDGIAVQKMRPNSYAADHTALAVGDKLLAIDDTPTEGLPFDDVIQRLLEAQQAQGCTLTLQNVEQQRLSLRQEALSRLGEEGEHQLLAHQQGSVHNRHRGGELELSPI